MTAREPISTALPAVITAPRRRRSHSTASSTNAVHARSPPPTLSKRSPSPRVSFTATQLSSDTKGVKNITRKVISTLEGLGHLEMVEQEGEYEEEEVERVLNALVGEGVVGGRRDRKGNGHYVNGNSKGDGYGPGIADKNEVKEKDTDIAVRLPDGGVARKKVDWEIPRKVLHSSIGFGTIYLYVSQGNPNTIVLILWTALAVIVPADIIRLRYPRFERIYERFLGFLMRESEKNTSNGVIWYILGVNFVLSCYPLDIATVAILILSWADTAASTVGRYFGSRTPKLPRRAPILGLPLAPRKSLAGFLAASLTGACIAIGFWGWLAPLRHNAADVSWVWEEGVKVVSSAPSLMGSLGVGLGLPIAGLGSWMGGAGGWLGLGVIGIVAGLVSGVAEALDLGSLDDNLTLPIISGGCILGFFKLLGLFSP